MTVASPIRKPAFLWQGILILLPVVVLAAMGVFALRADKGVAKTQAVQLAQAVADSLMPELLNQLVPTNDPKVVGFPAFKIDSAGSLLGPPPRNSNQSPVPLDTSLLSPQ